jgi:NifU-like protein involved in Fe-S cluster formation
MDEAVIKYYRRLLKSGFEYPGTLEDPSIFLDTVSENIPICGHMGDYLHLYIRVRNHMVEDIKYLCSCDPTANVAVEILCGLLLGKTLEEIEAINEGSFCEVLKADSAELCKKAGGLLELLHRGLARFEVNST